MRKRVPLSRTALFACLLCSWLAVSGMSAPPLSAAAGSSPSHPPAAQATHASAVAKVPAFISRAIPNAQPAGHARLKFLWWDVYDATLYAPNGRWQPQQPFALTLHYLRDFSGADIADRSAQEIRGLGFRDEVRLAAWHTEMQNMFPDVRPDTRLTGIYLPEKPTVFYAQDTRLGHVPDPEFGRWFFAIWLSEDTSEPAFRRQLLGLN